MSFSVPTINSRNFAAFVAGYEIDPVTGCWMWQINRSEKGYGRLRLSGRGKCKAHRVAWEIAYGTIPKGLNVCHHCDTPPCVNPEHLFLGTHQDNMRDMVNKGRGNRVYHGPLKNTLKYRGRLKIHAKKIRERVAAGEHMSHLAKEYGVSYFALRRVVLHWQWGEPIKLKRGRPRKDRLLQNVERAPGWRPRS